MEITSKELLEEKNWLNSEILSSLTNEVFEKVKSIDGVFHYDIKLLVNGIELEPKLLKDLLENVEEYIDKEANAQLLDKHNEKLEKIENLYESFKKKMMDILD